MAFEVLVKSQIRRLEHPSLECVDYVFRELQDVASYAALNVSITFLFVYFDLLNLSFRVLQVMKNFKSRFVIAYLFYLADA
jgi:hypothetical protein